MHSMLQAEHTLKPPALAALRKLLALFGVTMLASDLGDFLEDGFLSGKQAAALRTLQYQVGSLWLASGGTVHAFDGLQQAAGGALSCLPPS